VHPYVARSRPQQYPNSRLRKLGQEFFLPGYSSPDMNAHANNIRRFRHKVRRRRAKKTVRRLSGTCALLQLTVPIADVHAINAGLYSVPIAKFTGAGMGGASSRLVSGRVFSPVAFVLCAGTSVLMQALSQHKPS
jgi:hypothetical protein